MNTTGTRYRTLKSIFHERGKAAVQAELQARRSGHSTYLLNEFTVGEHPLFYLADRMMRSHPSNASCAVNGTLNS